MEEENRQERSFELRSEKVRSIVGQIPSSLVRYGITAIGVVLLCIVAVAYFLPYKQVYSGTAVIHEIGSEHKADTTEINVLLKFGEKRPNVLIEGASIEFQSAVEVAKGNILSLSMATYEKAGTPRSRFPIDHSLRELTDSLFLRIFREVASLTTFNSG